MKGPPFDLMCGPHGCLWIQPSWRFSIATKLRNKHSDRGWEWCSLPGTKIPSQIAGTKTTDSNLDVRLVFLTLDCMHAVRPSGRRLVAERVATPAADVALLDIR